ncbi:hypothetical protein [Petroclostridium sp. X23]|uniref:hypothetical protein n=1 Tax=Petroclostridium sp. X23 TaxID=3045146 RepID=UPI0024AE50EC|nr:hypothetical protein [Petroclostridium sp. X23]WHH59965.1 hypothetical protein QKW49_04230 [Petroclostridium sp. X23]
MSGMSATSGASSMPMKCNMKSMHESVSGNQSQKSKDTAVKQQNNQSTKIPNDILGNKIDIKI